MIVRSYRAEPEVYGAFPANGIERLAERMRQLGFTVMVPWLRAAARHVATGVPLDAWAASMPWDWSRSVFKQQWRKRR
jgi:hypothetical protein